MAVAAACGQGRRGARRRGQRGRSRLLRGQGRRGVVLLEELPAAADQHPSGDRHHRQRGYGTRRGGLLSLLRPLRTTPPIHKKGGFGKAIEGVSVFSRRWLFTSTASSSDQPFPKPSCRRWYARYGAHTRGIWAVMSLSSAAAHGCAHAPRVTGR